MKTYVVKFGAVDEPIRVRARSERHACDCAYDGLNIWSTDDRFDTCAVFKNGTDFTLMEWSDETDRWERAQ